MRSVAGRPGGETRSPRWRLWRRRSLLHFALGGLVLFAADRLWQSGDEAGEPLRERVVLSAARVARIRDEHARRFGTPPEAAELTRSIEAEIADELLYREALALGLDRGDPSVRWRVLQKMRFVSDVPDRSDEALIREGLSLGLDRDDLVIRRILAQKMRLLAQLPSRTEPIDEATLEASLAANRALYRRPPRVSLTHVFLSRERRGEALAGDARDLLRKLRAEDTPPSEASALGDSFPLDRRPRAQSERQLEALLGPEFAARVMETEPGRWSGPIGSAYGLHLVYVEERIPARDPPLDEVRAQVEQRLRAERGEALVEDLVRKLRGRYEVVVEGAASPGGVHPEAPGG